MYVIIVIDLVELHPIQRGIAVITPFGRPGDVQVADSRLQEHVGTAFSGEKKSSIAISTTIISITTTTITIIITIIIIIILIIIVIVIIIIV